MFFFFFKQKTAYEMRISDWSSDVCSSDLPHPDLARLLLEESGYVAMLQADRSAEATGRLENLNEFARAMEEFENLSAFLDHVALVMDNDADDSASKVTILTIHAAKGLEFDTVFLARSDEHTSELQS